MPQGIIPEGNISTVPYLTVKEICDGLDHKSKWRELVCIVKEKQFYLSNDEIEKIAMAIGRMPGASVSPSYDLWHQYGDFGMKVSNMIRYLDELKLEQELILLKDPEPLVMVRQPVQSIHVKRKDTLNISCKATGFPYPRYTWFVKYNNSTKYEERKDKQSAELEIPRIRRRHAGEYICRVHNSLTRKAKKKNQDLSSLLLFSKPCVVQVYGDEHINSDDDISDEEIDQEMIQTGYVPVLGSYSKFPNHKENSYRPRILKQPEPELLEVDAFNPICLECLAEGNPPPEYQWMKGDTILVGERKRTLLIQQCSVKDKGLYWCCINNGQEVHTRKVQVRVIDTQLLPGESILEIVQHPSNQEIEENGNAFVVCKAEGRGGVIEYKWFHVNKKGDTKEVKEKNISPEIPGSMLYIDAVNRQTEGVYYCEVTLRNHENNSKFIKRSCDATLRVMDSPSRFVSKPRDKVALFIGMQNYKANDNLYAVPWDIKHAAQRFEKMGYKVITLLDLTLMETIHAVNILCGFVNTEVYVTLYFVGHGFYHKGNHYLMTWDTPSGPRPEDCLCLEEVVSTVQHNKPAFLLLIVDMCRQSGGNKLADPTAEVKEFESSEKGNSITIFAASKYEQSFEPDQKGTAYQKEKRGVFSELFCKTLDEHGDKQVKVIFNYMLDEFRRYLATNGEKYPMHPEMHDTLLAHGRKLTDLVCCDGMEVEKEKSDQKFNFINQIPHRDVTISVAGISESCLIIRCIQRFSNQLDIVVNVKNPGSANDLLLDLTKDEKQNVTIEKCYNGNTDWWFTIKDIQRLECDFKPMLTLNYTDGNGYHVVKKVDLVASIPHFEVLRRPLISRLDVWQKPITSPTKTELKQPMENDETG